MILFKNLKLELFYFRKAIRSGQGFLYLKNRYFLVKKILSQGTLETKNTRDDLSMHLLTSHKDLLLAIWSLASFYKISSTIGSLYIHNDGTLTANDIKSLKKVFPSAKIINSLTFLIDYKDKISAFPILREFRSTYDDFSFKKIVDPFIVSDKRFKLIIDSDILWFKDPIEFQDDDVSYMQENNVSIFITYKDGLKLDTSLAKANSGIVLYDKNNFIVNRLNDFFKCIDTADRKSLRFADQYGYAYCLDNLKYLPKNRYTIKDKVSENVVCRHYTGPRRHKFYTEGLSILKK